MPRTDGSSRSSNKSPPKTKSPPSKLPARLPKPTTPPPRPPQANKPRPDNAPNTRPSRFREMAETAGAVTVGSVMGNMISYSVIGLFRNMFGGSSTSETTTKEKKECEFEMSKFLQCYNKNKANPDNLDSCDETYDRLRECQEYYRERR